MTQELTIARIWKSNSDINYMPLSVAVQNFLYNKPDLLSEKEAESALLSGRVLETDHARLVSTSAWKFQEITSIRNMEMMRNALEEVAGVKVGGETHAV